GQAGVVGDGAVQVGGIWGVVGGGVLAEGSEHAQAGAFVEGQAEVAESGGGGQGTVGQESGQIFAGDAVRQDTEQGQQVAGWLSHLWAGDRGFGRDGDAQLA